MKTRKLIFIFMMIFALLVSMLSMAVFADGENSGDEAAPNEASDNVGSGETNGSDGANSGADDAAAIDNTGADDAAAIDNAVADDQPAQAEPDAEKTADASDEEGEAEILALEEAGYLTVRGMSEILQVPVMITFFNQTDMVRVTVISATEEFEEADYEKFNLSMCQFMDSAELAMYM